VIAVDTWRIPDGPVPYNPRSTVAWGATPPVPTAREPRKSLAGQVFESNLVSGSQFPEGVLRPSPSFQHTTRGRCAGRLRGSGASSRGNRGNRLARETQTSKNTGKKPVPPAQRGSHGSHQPPLLAPALPPAGEGPLLLRGTTAAVAQLRRPRANPRPVGERVSTHRTTSAARMRTPDRRRPRGRPGTASTPSASDRRFLRLTRIMHTLGQETFESELKAIRTQVFRSSFTTMQPKQTAPQRTTPTPMRWHGPSTRFAEARADPTRKPSRPSSGCPHLVTCRRALLVWPAALPPRAGSGTPPRLWPTPGFT
jgi:hypothetical protein